MSPHGMTHQTIPDELYTIGSGGLDLVLEAPQDARGLLIGYNDLTDLRFVVCFLFLFLFFFTGQ